ncbi:MAG: tetratricopeptide repeat protein [Terricaulis sp.]
MTNDVEIEKLVRRFAAMRDIAARAARENPNDERALFGAAMAFRTTGDYAAALVQLESLNRLRPNNTHYLFELGQTLEYLGRFDDAVANYDASLRSEPLNYKARHAIVQLQPQTVAANHLAELEKQFALSDTVEPFGCDVGGRDRKFPPAAETLFRFGNAGDA